MPSSVCIRSISHLVRDRAAHTSIASRCLFAAPQSAGFSTSAARYALPSKKKTGTVAAPKRGVKSLNVKKGRKGVQVDTAKRPAQGERRALRKRIVLSNNNALEVPYLTDLEKTSALSKKNQGQVKGLPEEVVDSLRAVEAFKPTQGWSLFRRPATLIRKETVQLAALLKVAEGHVNSTEQAVEGREDGEAVDGAKEVAEVTAEEAVAVAVAEEGPKKTIRRVIVGEKMSGKSSLLLQGLALAFVRGWVVINLPDAQDIVNAHTAYAPLPESEPTQYTQDIYTANLLSQILKANKGFFSNTTPITTQPELGVPLPANTTLEQLVNIGINNPDISWPVFVALWAELTLPGRPPIMLGIDGLSHIMRNSEYFSADVKPIHAHDLTLIRHFIDHLSGKSSLPNGGMVLAAISKSNSPTSAALDFSISVAEARQARSGNLPTWNLYTKVDQRVMDVLKDIEVIKVGGLSKAEARALIEYYAASGMLRAKVDEPFVTEKWSLAGMGNVGELERATVRLRV
ncbi:hypothetical protein K504DRAFT_482152 [Pleomassaria siparia CBS 279.74]|uniref:Small ribosomal subunit protein mS29 n=1 Tax=Pleomassaria siparia CBS 279.74 TaxID=1314801 RepID=A0A6G1K7G3_9PLEO|nr:hypothetical protein K504DRAFT_482152 [Pleomassaria siparia CBS 279.74]